MKKAFRALMLCLYFAATVDAGANQVVDTLQISGVATNGATYTGQLDFNTTTFAAYNGSFVVNVPGYSPINLSYQDPLPAGHMSWCEFSSSPWCAPSTDTDYTHNTTYPSTYFMLSDGQGAGGYPINAYFIYFHLNDLVPLQDDIVTFSPLSGSSPIQYFVADIFPQVVAPSAILATENITLLRTTEITSAPSGVPEPGSVYIVGLGLAGLALVRRRHSNRGQFSSLMTGSRKNRG